MIQVFKFWKDDTEKQTVRVLDNFHNIFSEMLKKTDITLEIKETKKHTSDKARNYIFGCIMPLALQGLRDLGNDIPNNKTGLEYVYQYLKAQGGFFELKEITLKDGTTTTFAEFETFSKKGDRKRQSEFIEFCHRWCAENLYVNIPNPEEWKAERGYK